MKIVNTYLTISLVISFLFFSVNTGTYGQNNGDIAFTQTYYNYSGDPNEPVNGYWTLKDFKTERKSAGYSTKWVTQPENLTVKGQWLDYLKIRHTVSCNFEWLKPPANLIPGTDNTFKITYKNNEYSTTGKVKMGVNVTLDKIGNTAGSQDLETIDIIKLVKGFNNHETEDKYGFFKTPKYYRGDNETIELIIDCYLESDHYITTYYYKWTE
jgi:hypothetical protein